MKYQRMFWRFVIISNILIGIGLGLGLLPAAAQSLPDSNEVWQIFENGDALSDRYLSQIFGPLFQTNDGSEAPSVLSEVIGYVNLFVVVIGGLMFFYNMTIGVLQSAHEGEVLGRRWSSLWAPIRVIFAIGLLVPVPGGGGYNVAQSGVQFLSTAGTSMASTIWTVAARSVLSDDIPLSSESPRFPPSIVEEIYRQAACISVVDYQINVVNQNLPSSADPARIDWLNVREISSIRTPTDRVSYLTSILRESEEPSLVGLCGGWSTPIPPAYLNDLGVEGQQVVDAFTYGHAQLMTEISLQMLDLTNQHFQVIFNGDQTLPDISNEIAEIQISANERMAEFSREIRALGIEASGQDDARDMLMSHVNGGGGDWGQGWTGAGSWYISLARFNNRLSSLTDATPSIQQPDLRADPAEIFEAAGGTGSGRTYLLGAFGGRPTEADLRGLPTSEEALRLLSDFDRMFSESAVRLAGLGYQLSPNQMADINQDSGGSFWEYIPGLQESLERVSNSILAAFDPSQMLSHDPMISIINVGKSLMGLAMVLAGGVVVVGLPTGGAAAIVLTPIIASLMACGALLAFILPIMPFIIFNMAVIGYFLTVIEAVIAVSLWALGHMRLDGEGISGEAGKNGWLLLLSLTFTPSLMIVGFLAGMIIFRVGAGIIGTGFYFAASSIVGGDILFGLLAIFGYSILQAIIFLILLEKSFSLIVDFPSRVFRWIGQGDQIVSQSFVAMPVTPRPRPRPTQLPPRPQLPNWKIDE